LVIRCAFFEGRIHSGREAEFDTFVQEQLVPLWTRFPNALEVRILREREIEDGSHRFPMILQTTYPSREAINIALQSPERFTSRDLTKALLQMFEGRVFHVIYDLSPERPLLPRNSSPLEPR
jgi:hypothetical protein